MNMKLYRYNNLHRNFMLVGSIITFAVGGTIVFSAVCLFDTFSYESLFQVALDPKETEIIIRTIFAYTIIGSVLMLYPIIALANFYLDDCKDKGGDDQ